MNELDHSSSEVFASYILVISVLRKNKDKIAMVIGITGIILVLVMGSIELLEWNVVGVLIACLIGVTGFAMKYLEPKKEKTEITHAHFGKNVMPIKSEGIFSNRRYREMLVAVTKSLQSGDELCGIARIPFIALTEKIEQKFNTKSSVAKDAYNFTLNVIEAMKRDVRVRYLLDVNYTGRMIHDYLDPTTTKEFLEQLEWVLTNYSELEILPIWEDQESSNFLVFHGRANHVFEYLKDPAGNFIFAKHDKGNVPTQWYVRFFQHLWEYSKKKSEMIITKDASIREIKLLVLVMLKKALNEGQI